MSKFKIGDIVKNVSGTYNITTRSKGWLGRVVCLGDETFTAITVDIDESYRIGAKFGSLKYEDFELVVEEKEDSPNTVNYIPQVAKMLDLEIGEEFYSIYSDGSKKKVVFKNDGLYYIGIFDQRASSTLSAILAGKYKIERLPWRPKLRDEYYYININGDVLTTVYYPDNLMDRMITRVGNCYPTREEAAKHIDEWKKWYEEV